MTDFRLPGERVFRCYHRQDEGSGNGFSLNYLGKCFGTSEIEALYDAESRYRFPRSEYYLQ